jgi:signal transduction histidine kinase
MIPTFLLDWAVRALSFFNTIALLWLGLAVLLNAERRRWGTLAAGGGLVLGGIFFAGHTTIVSRDFGTFDAEMELWWRLGWLPFVSPPYIWYVVMAWYASVLDTRLHRAAVVVLGLFGLLALGMIVFISPLPGFGELRYERQHATVELGGVPIFVLLYPAYSALCISLALAALRRPTASRRFMGDLARLRARPWLVASSGVLLLVSLLVGAVAAWVVRGVQSGELILTHATITSLKTFDLAICGLLALAVVLTGRAIVSYEVFTGKALPRGGLHGQWRNSLILAASFAAVMSASLDLPVDPVFHLLFATVLITVLFALHSWRVYADREASIERLRPFVTSERLYERLLTDGRVDPIRESADDDAPLRFAALCRDVLGARVAYLVALGPLAPLAGPPLAYPAGVTPPDLIASRHGGLVSRFRSPQTMCVAVEPGSFAGAVWAIPLWSERGLVGALLLGAKVDDGLYTQEEIEIARATGERLVDTRASAEMARRLMALQRQRLAESQIIDARARRSLHDEILPRLHTALLTLGGAIPRTRSPFGQRTRTASLADDPVTEVASQIAEVHREIANLLRAMPTTTAPRIAQSGLLGALRQVIEGEQAGLFESVTWQVTADADQAARAIPALSAEVLFGAAREAVRNAARYGRAGDAGRALNLTVAATLEDGNLAIQIEDDGVGIGGALVAVSEASDPLVGLDEVTDSTGQGLALHSTMMAVIGGTLTAESPPRGGTRITLTLPGSTVAARGLLGGVEDSGELNGVGS